MTTKHNPGIRVTAPSTALQQMCNYVAIAETKNPTESLRELILHTLFVFEEDKASSIDDVAKILNTVFGVDAPDHQIQEALDQLTFDGQIHQPLGTNYVLTTDTRARVRSRIHRAAQLQKGVREQWLAETIRCFPDLNADHVWNALQGYLAKAFLRHGIQVAVFLDPSVELPPEFGSSLSTLLDEAVKAQFDSLQWESAKRAISDFLASVGKNQERAQFIAECADGAANYFSLEISPDAAKRFRETLCPLTLFCDTNFLFGILNLHVHPLVDVSNELLKSITTHRLKIKLRYHEATFRELQSSISFYGEILRRHKWERALSRAASASHFMSGIELKFHEKNAETGIDVDDFLRPYQHVDVLLAQHNISFYRSPNDRLKERATLEAEYQEYLERIGKGKAYELIKHDVTVLDCVRSLRSNTASTLEAGALFVSCDYALYRFDSDASRSANTQASVVLPNVLWQILRPFIPASQDFDRSFAETFAIPEFRTIGSGAAKACSKMLGLLAAYKDLPEETAAKLLSNDLLIDRLRATQDDEQFQALVESAIASDNKALFEERAALAKQVETLRTDKERIEKELKDQKEMAAEISKEKHMAQELKKEIEILAASKRDAEAQAEKASEKLAEMIATKEMDEKRAQRKRLWISAAIRTFLAVFILLASESIIGFLAWHYGQGVNLFQRITNSWQMFAAIFVFWTILLPFILGRDCIRLLKSWKGKTGEMEVDNK